jgi:hypothetical protein
MSDSQQTKQSIKKLEEQYVELNSNLQHSKNKFNDDEHALLMCLNKLMPLQNSYLSGIIRDLNDKLDAQTVVKLEPESVSVDKLSLSNITSKQVSRRHSINSENVIDIE